MLGELLALGALGALAGGVNWVLPHWAKRRAIRRLDARCRSERALALSYDDGPSASLTPALLELLAAARARATFFPVGAAAAREPELCQRIAAAGHELGSHSEVHLHPWKVWPWRAAADLRRGQTTMARWSPQTLLRPPHGKLTAWTWLSVRRQGVALCWWTIDSGDTYGQRPSTAEVVARVQARGGGVVLLHDRDRGPEHGRFVLETTRALLELAQHEGLALRTLGELVRDPAPSLR